MNRIQRRVMLGLTALALALPLVASAGIKIVAAENFYGDVAKQIGGAHVDVVSILASPDQDPHLFEASPSTARAIADASIVVYNGVGYDPWIEPLLAASPSSKRVEIVAGTLLGREAGVNPHLWYDPATMPAVATAMTDALAKADPAHKSDYDAGRKAFMASLGPVALKIASIRKAHPNIAVTATEPVFGPMAQALGFTMRNDRFQLAVMNGTDPAAKDVAAFESDLRTRKVGLLFYNRQATDPAAMRLREIAMAAKVPVVGVTETQPAAATYASWMLGQLEAIEKALEP